MQGLLFVSVSTMFSLQLSTIIVVLLSSYLDMFDFNAQTFKCKLEDLFNNNLLFLFFSISSSTVSFTICFPLAKQERKHGASLFLPKSSHAFLLVMSSTSRTPKLYTSLFCVRMPSYLNFGSSEPLLHITF